MRESLRHFELKAIPWKDDTVLRDVDTAEDYAGLEGNPP